MPGLPATSGKMSTRKRKRKQKGVPGVPQLPPEVGDDEVEVSDEDVEFMQQHEDYAGFLANLDTPNINKQLMGPRQKKNAEDIESVYEKRADRIAARAVDGNSVVMSVDPVDALPVKSLAGELHYRSTAMSKALGAEETATVGERRALLLKGKEMRMESAQHEAAILAEGQTVAKKPKLTKAERRKEMKELKKKEKEDKKQEGRVAEEILKPIVLQPQEAVVSYISVQQRRAELKARMAEIGSGLLADPEGNLSTLKELQEMCKDRDDSVAQLALLSSMAVFKDLLPGYRIRLPTDKELEMQVSKEIRKLRDFESALLRHYQTYVQTLIQAAKSRPRRQIALRCMCSLLDAAPHFNYRDSLLKAIVPRMMSQEDEISAMSCEALKSLFKNEGKHGGEATVEAVQLIAELVKIRHCRLHPSVLEVFMVLSFDEDLERSSTSGRGEDRIGGKQKSKRQEKQEKKTKKRELAAQLRKEVKADFKEASVAPDTVERRRLQTLTLAAVFETYFRVLKTSLDPADERTKAAMSLEEDGPVATDIRPLLGPALDGLAKFSHLISVDFMADLLAVLRTLAAGGHIVTGTQSDNLLSVGERLQCCIIAFKIVRSNMDALNIDLREFYVRLYNLLFEFNSVRDEEKYGEVFVQALQVMLLEGRQHDMQRAAGFIKRLSSLALHLGPAEAMAALVTVRQLLQRYSKCRSILDNDGGGGSVGGNVAMFQVDGEDPDLSGALSSVLWELSLLRQHAHPGVVKLAAEISNMSTSSSASALLATLSPVDALKLYSTRQGGFRPAPALPPKVVKKNAYKDPRDISDPCLLDLLGKEDLLSLDEVNDVSNNMVKHFRVLRDYLENDQLRKEHRRVSASLDLYKQYMTSKPSKSKNRTTKRSKIAK